jgi:predicted dehydrogenase
MPAEPGLGVLGAGNYANAVFLPNVVKSGGVNRVGVATSSGLSARHAASRYGFGYASSDESELLNDPKIDVMAVLTRHNQHARQVLAGLRAGKSVFCEKPLALTEDELAQIEQALANPASPLLMVGFNRRFAPYAVQLKTFLLGCGEPLFAHYRVNAGWLPANHWTHDPVVGGGRIIGEGCHFIDFLTFLVGAPPIQVTAQSLPDGSRYQRGDNALLTLTFADGSVGTIAYASNGDKSFPKERVEVFCGGRVGVLDDFRSLELVKDGRRKVYHNRLRQDKGHLAAWQAFLNAVKTCSQPPIPYAELIGVSRAAIQAAAQLAGTESAPE